MAISAESGMRYRPQFYKVGLRPFPHTHSFMSQWKQKRAKTSECPKITGEYSFMSEWKKIVENWLSGWNKKCGRMSEFPSYLWQGIHVFKYMTWRPKIFFDASFFLLCFIWNTRKDCLNMNASHHDYEYVIFMFVTWCIQAEFMYAWNDSFANESSHIQQCVTSRICMSHSTYINESCHIYLMSLHSQNKKCIHTSAARHKYSWVIANTSMSHVIHVNESCHVYQCAMSYVWMSHVT